MNYTADLCDEFPEKIRILNLPFKSYGKKTVFEGEIATLKVYEDNSLIKRELQNNGKGKVLLIDGGGSKRCALIGDNLAQLAINNDWNGVILYGCLRNSQQINKMDVGIMALGTCPRKSIKRDEGQKGISLLIENTTINHRDYLYADLDGVIITENQLY